MPDPIKPCEIQLDLSQSVSQKKKTQMPQAPSAEIPSIRVPQPPSAVDSRSLAKLIPDFHRRNLPHYESRGGPLFVTFSTFAHLHLPQSVRSKILQHCLHDHTHKMILHCAVIMPDHVHMIYQPLLDPNSNLYTIKEIVGSIKSFSSHSANKVLARKGALWNEESFDHILRSEEQGWVKIEYVIHNPVRKGLCVCPADYPWLWVNPDLQFMREAPRSVEEVLKSQREILADNKATAEGGCDTQI